MNVSPEVNVYSLMQRGEVSRPKPGDITGGIYPFIEKGQSVVGAGEHSLIQLPATKPHTDGRHDVGFFLRGDLDGYRQWDDGSWIGLAEDTQFLQALDGYVARRQQLDPDLSAYFVIGFAKPDSGNGHDNTVLRRGLQSVYNGHIHLVENWSDGLYPSRTLKPGDPGDLRRIGIFANYAGEFSIDMMGREAAQLGQHVIYRQPVGPFDAVSIVERTMFASPNLQTALRKSLAFLESVNSIWREHTETISRFSVPYEDMQVPVLQTPVPGAAFIFLNPADQYRLGLPGYRMLIEPLAVCGPPNVLFDGMFEWYTPPTTAS